MIRELFILILYMYNFILVDTIRICINRFSYVYEEISFTNWLIFTNIFIVLQS
jgi:hypothetical protein